VLEETAPGFTAEDIRELTEMQFEVAPAIGTMV
jgi:acyl CoA:acetate/3-ketoacid CoA transferase beta subunit